MGPIGVPELLIILVLVLILFGAGRLPEVMSSMGKGVREFRKASSLQDDAGADAPKNVAAAAPTAGGPAEERREDERPE